MQRCLITTNQIFFVRLCADDRTKTLDYNEINCQKKKKKKWAINTFRI